MTLDNALRVAALVLAIIAGILAFGWIGDATILQVLGLDSFALACWFASGVTLPRNAP